MAKKIRKSTSHRRSRRKRKSAFSTEIKLIQQLDVVCIGSTRTLLAAHPGTELMLQLVQHHCKNGNYDRYRSTRTKLIKLSECVINAQMKTSLHCTGKEARYILLDQRTNKFKEMTRKQSIDSIANAFLGRGKGQVEKLNLKSPSPIPSGLKQYRYLPRDRTTNTGHSQSETSTQEQGTAMPQPPSIISNSVAELETKESVSVSTLLEEQTETQEQEKEEEGTARMVDNNTEKENLHYGSAADLLGKTVCLRPVQQSLVAAQMYQYTTANKLSGPDAGETNDCTQGSQSSLSQELDDFDFEATGSFLDTIGDAHHNPFGSQSLESISLG